MKEKNFIIAIHGGAGNLMKVNFPPEKEKACREGLETAILKGYAILEKGGSALDAVEATVNSLEDNPYFNAGKGGVFNAEGEIEHDASIMCGKRLKTGANTGTKTVKYPISLARKIMENSKHVFFMRDGAERKAKEYGLELVEPSYFHTDFRYEQWQRIKDYKVAKLDHSSDDELPQEEDVFGTVGAVALDVHGNLAAATSTGGTTNKELGRIGDSPIIGAGTYANNLSCAVSSTGYGEFFIRALGAYDIHCLMEYKGLSLVDACHQSLHRKVGEIGGEGGFVAVDHLGNVAFEYNTPGMFRAAIGKNHPLEVRIWEE
jgi:beta-aspartyl-peptidase (threonine type)